MSASHPCPYAPRRAVVLGALALLVVPLAGQAAGDVSAPVNGDAADPPAVTARNWLDWQPVTLAQLLEQTRRNRSNPRAATRMLPLLGAPTQHGALWLGLAVQRGDGLNPTGVRLELRWTVPLDRIGLGR